MLEKLSLFDINFIILIITIALVFIALAVALTILKKHANTSKAILITGIIFGFILGVISHKALSSNFLFLITLSGLIGGLIYSSQDQLLSLPSISKEGIRPGLFIDCLTGIVGAYLIFLILPSEVLSGFLTPSSQGVNTQQSSISAALATAKLFGLGVVGGFGGQALLKHTLDMVLKQKVDRINSVVIGIEKGTEAKALIASHLNQGTSFISNELKVLEESLENTTPEIRTEIRNEVEKTWESKVSLDVTLQPEPGNEKPSNLCSLKIAIQILEVLVKVDSMTHQNHGKLGYAYLVSGEFEQAKAQFTEAIGIRNRTGFEASDFKIYEFNRAVAYYHLGKVEEMKKDLETVSIDFSNNPKLEAQVQRFTNAPQVKALLTNSSS